MTRCPLAFNPSRDQNRASATRRLHRSTSLLALLLLIALTSGCSKSAPPPAAGAEATTQQTKARAASKPASDHGQESSLGKLTLAGFQLDVVALGTIAAGEDAAVAASVTAAPAGKDWRRANVYLWIQAADGKRLTAPSKAVVEAGRLHMHASVPAGSPPAAELIFRLRDGELDERVSLRLPGAAPAAKPEAPPAAGATAAEAHAGHSHAKTPHDGIVAKLGGPGAALDGWLECKLHDDKGDIELWLGKDQAMTTPLDLPLDTKPTIRFVDRDGRTVTLTVRDQATNPDESGAANVRAGETNYFIFPGTSGADASWLKGAKFALIIFVTVLADGKETRSAEFVLRPHTHAHGHSH